MKNFLPIIFLFLLSIPFGANSQKKEVVIRILQEKSILLEGYETSVVLQKKTFKIQVLMENVKGIYVFAAFNDSICCRLSEVDPIQDLMNLPDRTMSEEDYNKHKELLVNDENNCAYWYYDNDISWKGFNKKVFPLDSNRVVAIKSVKQVYYVPNQEEIKLKDIEAPLHLLFVAVSEFDHAGKPVRELLRKKLKIDWVDED